MSVAVIAPPTLVIDTREQHPLAFTWLPSRRGTLLTGDYSFVGGEQLFAVERKSIQDLVACCTGANRVRFERELHRLRGFWFARLLIVGREADVQDHQYFGQTLPKSILHTVRAFEARYVPVVWSPDASHAAQLVEQWAYWFARELGRCATVSHEKESEPTETIYEQT